ncbi:hypothetical protein TTHERM_00734090 (macronuclear) [Tetrahymena thermophila SB210]|uniref:Uncharacterized protein n=1 Tax=Tetrahymena thermophila (strain SB210) TaxID=312017 RepID=Q231Y8_TETTS|nr:hypothetical protein TTHERM_00734090 [Tetrahymena thermophila SB210]EAR91312.1 hypothetical protein TTHERM_00734090 [Tetrahymena thermophila SB210]|eukprot:XP_001011557.1 hypothetical protein TTHERM_00734090 [Tetrahymena thermophila SB210]
MSTKVCQNQKLFNVVDDFSMISQKSIQTSEQKVINLQQVLIAKIGTSFHQEFNIIDNKLAAATSDAQSFQLHFSSSGKQARLFLYQKEKQLNNYIDNFKFLNL